MNQYRRDGSGGGRAAAALVAAALAVAAAAPARAQGPGQGAGKAKAAQKAARGKARAVVKRGDPLALPAQEKDQAAAGPAAAGETYHFRLRLHAFDDTTLVTSYYPAQPPDDSKDPRAPVALLVHEKERSSKDFEDPIDELKKQGLAEHLQAAGYAVLALDLRGHGANTRKAVSDREWADMVDDLQAAYQFLVDRHNRGELNLARLGVVALGEGANLAAAWAYLPGGGVSSEGRVTDIAGMALVSPLPRGEGLGLSTVVNALAPRVALLLMAGERDAPSHDAVKGVRAAVEKFPRQNSVELLPSSLHGSKLLKLEPRAATVITRFLDARVKVKSTEWEPRFNLSPVAYTDIEVVRHTKAADKAKAATKAAPAGKKDAPDREKDQAKEKPAEKKDPG